MLHHTEIVADEEIGQAEITSEFQEQIDDLRLNRDVERRDRFIADDKCGLDRERSRDPDPLPLTAGKLVRIPPRKDRIQADPLHQAADISTFSRRVTMPWATGASPMRSIPACAD